MHTPEIQKPQVGRRRGRYSNDFKRQVVAACLAPGVSTAAIALSNGLNANLLRRWVVESSPRSDSGQSKSATALAPVHGAYFSPSWTAFQAHRGRDFSVIVDGISN
jgi:hypothetical protein